MAYQRTVLFLFSWLAFATVSAAPESEPWPRWEAHDPHSAETVDHSAWSALLGRVVATGQADRVNRVDYAGFSDADQAELRGYLQGLQDVDVDQLNRAEQKAYWINLYNAVTVDLILQHYPVRSIRKIRLGGLFSGPWDKALVEVAGQPLSLNDIEHRILRPIWRDPLIHYGVNCASLGCPNLLPEAYTGANVDQLLAQNARDFINSERGVSLARGGLRLSKIYQWFAADFGDRAGLIDHLREYANPSLLADIERAPKVRAYRYDWALNEAKTF